MQEKLLEINGARLYCRVDGDGEPLVFLHGNGEDHSYFAPQIAFFSKDYKCVALDSRGHGQSAFGDGDFSLAQMAEDLAAVLDSLDIQRAHVIGFSDGGNIALLFALAYPTRVKSLIVVGANVSPKGVKRRIQMPIVLAHAALGLFAFKSEKTRRKRKIWGLMIGQPDISFEELAALPMPALVLAGSNDMIKESHTRAIAAALPNAKLHIVPKSTHFLSSTHADLFNRIVLDFLHLST
ncbi:MAG: alpha/beta hydrolase [Oscillospiraceae bacterium]|jgi:pimeloyl-ACP methyl ester carboxylesterase|nr:alpha/beta hydrolase [Oscillospiraceae bacterium]